MGVAFSIAILSFLIFFHELGHFLAARLYGVKVEVFSIGFGRKIVEKQIGQTKWRISLIPLGGYVQMKGHTDTKTTKVQPDSYAALSPLKRVVILAAGPFANFFLAFVFYVLIALGGIDRILPVVGDVMKQAPAQGVLQKGDRIVAINGEKVRYWEDISRMVNQHKRDLLLQVQRGSSLLLINISPQKVTHKDLFDQKHERYVIGITPLGEKEKVYFEVFDLFKYAANQTYEATKWIFDSLKKLVLGVVGIDQIGGVISIVDATAKASEYGMQSLLFMAALISVNLGILNLLPIPALDGGHILLSLFEAIAKRAPTKQVMIALSLWGWAFIIFLMGVGLYNDIMRLWGNP